MPEGAPGVTGLRSGGTVARGPACAASRPLLRLLQAGTGHVDPDHETGRVRGVLCFNRNPVLSKLRDGPAVLCRGIVYLEGNAWKP